MNSEPNTATPIEPPMARKKLMVEVATPRCSTGASFWVATTRVCSTEPMPNPSTAIAMPECSRVLSVPNIESRYIPTVAMAVPTIGRNR